MASIINSTTTNGVTVQADNSGSLQLATNNGTTAVTIDTSQRVGVGTTSPTGKLHVYGSGEVQTLQRSSGSANNYTLFKTESGADQAYLGFSDGGVNDFAIYNVQNGYVRIATNNTERMRIDSSGNLLVGTTSSITGGRSAFWSSTAAAAAEFRVNAGSSDATQAVTIIKNSTTNSTAQVLMNFTVNNGNTGAGQINCNGASAAAFGTFSDERLKENIESLPSQLQNICSLRPVEFNYIESEGGGHQIGFIAQEMQTVYPDAVGERQDGMLTVTGWSKTEARLVAAIQELKAELDSVKAELNTLKNSPVEGVA